MHEFGIVQELVENLELEARRHQAQRVTKVKIRIGSLSDMNPESISFYFETLKKENPVTQEAALEVEKENTQSPEPSRGLILESYEIES